MENQRQKKETDGMKNVFALGFVSFFTDISSEMVFSLLPIFVVGLPGSGTEVLGIIEGAGESLSNGMRAVSGFFSDKLRKRKLLVFIGYAVSNVVKPFFAFSRTSFEVLAIRVAERIGKGIRTSPRDALLSESISEQRRGTAFGLHRTLDQSGAIVGPLFASFAMYVLGLNIRDIFWISFIPGSVALLILLVLVKEQVGKQKSEFKIFAGIHEVFRGGFPFLLFVVGVFSLGAFNYSFVLVNASNAGVDYRLVPLFYTLINVTHTVVAIPSGFLSDRIGKEKVLILGYGGFLLTAVLLYFRSADYFFAILIALVFGVYDGINNTVPRALVPQFSASELRGTAYGLYYLVVGLCQLIANVAVGALWQVFGPKVSAIYSIILSTLAISSVIVFLLHKRK
ncbi:MAG: MFS transporter [Candidatus Bathyarchaeia archaeon]